VPNVHDLGGGLCGRQFVVSCVTICKPKACSQQNGLSITDMPRG
jgi:hypothetical protein